MPYRYGGQRQDALTGLYQLRARSYDPTSGRFTSRDTAGVVPSNPVELDRYSYAEDNPITLSDPSGHATATAQTAAAGLDAWVAAVAQMCPDEVRPALSAFHTWREKILAFFRFLPTCLTNGFVEGKNNRTMALMRQAYGSRNRRHLRMRILMEVA